MRFLTHGIHESSSATHLHLFWEFFPCINFELNNWVLPSLGFGCRRRRTTCEGSARQPHTYSKKHGPKPTGSKAKVEFAELLRPPIYEGSRLTMHLVEQRQLLGTCGLRDHVSY